jgi:hypothetical protein
LLRCNELGIWRWVFGPELEWLISPASRRPSVSTEEQALIESIRWIYGGRKGDPPVLDYHAPKTLARIQAMTRASERLAPSIYATWRTLYGGTAAWMELPRRHQGLWIERTARILLQLPHHPDR